MFFLVVALNRPSQSLILDEIRQSHVCVATANFGATGLFLPLVLGLNHANNGFLFIGVATHFIFHWLLHFQLCNGADEVGLALGHNHIFINSFRAIGFSVCLKTISYFSFLLFDTLPPPGSQFSSSKLKTTPAITH